jgi:hypothetical protein
VVKLQIDGKRVEKHKILGISMKIFPTKNPIGKSKRNFLFAKFELPESFPFKIENFQFYFNLKVERKKIVIFMLIKLN